MACFDNAPFIPRVFWSERAIHKKIPRTIEIIAFVTTNGLFDPRDRRCGVRVGILGRRIRARGDAEGVPFERGSGGGTDGGGKLT